MGFAKQIKQLLKKMFSSRRQIAKATNKLRLNADIQAIELAHIHQCPELYPCLECFIDGTTNGPNSHKCPELYPCLVCLVREDCVVDDTSQTDVIIEQQSNYGEKNENHEALRQFFARRGRKFVPKLH